jgi:[methyl-Co(III) methanol-specific corrinoid protein]:coenzyme M methyltransferase
MELMSRLGIYFPEAHRDAEKMAALAEAGHTLYGYDVVMPLFSVCHDSEALGCNVDWGDRATMPRATRPIWTSDIDVRIPPDFLLKKAVRVPLDAIGILKRRLGEDAAVCGKVFGPWTLGYHTFGIENWLIGTLDAPDMIKRAIDKMKAATVEFALAQIDAGADCMMIADHATRDLCSPAAYREFLKDLHSEFASAIPCPCILHICGDTSDRIGMIAETGLACFHWDTKLGSPAKARSLAGERLALMGGINNPDVLLRGTPEQVERACREAVDGGTDVVAPECAVPLGTPMRNLAVVGTFVNRERSKVARAPADS